MQFHQKEQNNNEHVERIQIDRLPRIVRDKVRGI